MKKAINCQKNVVKLVTTINLAFAALVFLNAPVRALQFNFTYAHGTHQEVIDGFEKAGQIWSSKLQDTFLDVDCYCNRNTTVNIFINFEELSNPKALGGAKPAMVQVKYQSFLDQAFKDITSSDDLLAFKNLQIYNNDKAINEYILPSLGISTYNTDTQNRAILSQAGFTLDSNRSIFEQSNQIFQQLNLNHIQSLNRNPVKFEPSDFSMMMSQSNSVSFEQPEQLKTLDSNTLIDNNNNQNNTTLWLTTANAKALNIVKGNDSGFDAQIALSNSMLDTDGTIISHSQWLAKQSGTGNFLKDSIWDFSRVYSDNVIVASHKYDFLTVAQHEIGHALGVVSGVDAFDTLMNMVAEGGSKQPLKEKDLSFVSSMDLFRYSALSKEMGVFDWSSGAGKYFSIDGGVTKLAEFDGTDYQTSHWSAKADSPLGIMHPVLKTGQTLDISDLDLKLLNVIGWDLYSQFADRTGVNFTGGTADGVLSSKVRELGLDWQSLEFLLTKPASTLVNELTTELAAIAPYQSSRIETQLKETETELKADLEILKDLQEQKQKELKVKQTELENLQEQQTQLQKRQADLQKSLQSNQAQIDSLEIKLQTAKDTDKPKIQTEIDKLRALQSSLDEQFQTHQSEQTKLQPLLQTKQAEVDDLQTQFNNLQTTSTIDALKRRLAETNQQRNTLKSLGKSAERLTRQADPKTIKAQLDKLKALLENQLTNFQGTENAWKRTQQESQTLEQIVRLAEQQEKVWNQVIFDYEYALFSALESQVRQWLEATPEELKNYMADATLRQTATLLHLVNTANGMQKKIWEAKLTQAIMLLRNVDQTTARQLLKKATNDLAKLSRSNVVDNLMSRLSSGSTTTGTRYWQTMSTNYMASNQYSETQHNQDAGLVNATLNQLFYAKLEQLQAGNSQAEQVPEPASTMGILGLALLGIRSLFKAQTKNKGATPQHRSPRCESTRTVDLDY